LGHGVITYLLETNYIYVAVIDRQDVTIWSFSGKVSARPAANIIQIIVLKNWWRYGRLDHKAQIII
jgi:hypothetical protein